MKNNLLFILLSILGYSMSSFSQSPESTLPTPDSAFFNNPKPLAGNIIDKYLKSYFDVTKPLTKIRKCGDTGNLLRTEFGAIAIEVCVIEIDSLEYYERTDEIIFYNYSFEEVTRILKLLFVDDEIDHWDGNSYGQGGSACYVEIINEKDQIIVTYGCGGC